MTFTFATRVNPAETPISDQRRSINVYLYANRGEASLLSVIITGNLPEPGKGGDQDR